MADPQESSANAKRFDHVQEGYLVASAGSKGNTKRHSELQKSHYKAYRLVDRARTNKIAKLRHRIRLNEAMAKRKAKRKNPRVVRPDVGAINALKALGITTWNR